MLLVGKLTIQIDALHNVANIAAPIPVHKAADSRLKTANKSLAQASVSQTSSGATRNIKQLERACLVVECAHSSFHGRQQRPDGKFFEEAFDVIQVGLCQACTVPLCNQLIVHLDATIDDHKIQE